MMILHFSQAHFSLFHSSTCFILLQNKTLKIELFPAQLQVIEQVHLSKPFSPMAFQTLCIRAENYLWNLISNTLSLLHTGRPHQAGFLRCALPSVFPPPGIPFPQILAGCMSKSHIPCDMPQSGRPYASPTPVKSISLQPSTLFSFELYFYTVLLSVSSK